MADPSSAAAGSIAGAASQSWWMTPFFMQLAAMAGGGILGAVLIVLSRPPRTFREGVLRVVFAFFVTITCAPVLTEWLCHNVTWFNIHGATFIDAQRMTFPLYMLIGALSYAVVSAVGRFDEILAVYGAQRLAAKLGIKRGRRDADK